MAGGGRRRREGRCGVERPGEEEGRRAKGRRGRQRPPSFLRAAAIPPFSFTRGGRSLFCDGYLPKPSRTGPLDSSRERRNFPSPFAPFAPPRLRLDGNLCVNFACRYRAVAHRCRFTRGEWTGIDLDYARQFTYAREGFHHFFFLSLFLFFKDQHSMELHETEELIGYVGNNR